MKRSIGPIVFITLIILITAQLVLAAENYVILPNDASNTGKKTRTYDQSINAQTVHASVGLIGDPAGTNIAGVTSGGAIKIDGTGTTQPVSISSMPTTPVTGTFWQATQPVSLSSVPSHAVTGTFWQATQPVSLSSVPSHAVTGTFWQATQPVSGTITANINSADGTASGSVTNGQTVSIALAGYYSASVVISGAYTVATFVPEVSSDGGTTWTPTQFFDPNAQTTAATVSANGTWVITNVGGMSNVRVRCSAMATGSATINLRATTAQANSLIPLGAKTTANSMAVNIASDQIVAATINTSAKGGTAAGYPTSYALNADHQLLETTSVGLSTDGSITSTTCPGSGCVSTQVPPGSNSIVIVLVGTGWTGTVALECDNTGAGNWVGINAVQRDVAGVNQELTSWTTDFYGRASAVGCHSARVRATAFTAGSMAVHIHAMAGIEVDRGMADTDGPSNMFVPVVRTIPSATVAGLTVGGVANDTTAVANGLETQPAVSRATPTATTAGRSEKLQVSATNGGAFVNLVGGAGVLPAAVQPTNTAAAGNALEVLPGIGRSAISAVTAGRSAALAIDATTGFQLHHIADGASYLKASVLANDTTAALNGLQVLPAIARAVPTAVTAGRGEMEQLDAATGAQFVEEIATTTNIGSSATANIAVNTTTGVKAAAGNLYGVSAANAAASVCWLQFYNSNAPTCGTSVVLSLALPTTPGVLTLFGDVPLYNFSAGIGVCVGSTPTGAGACGSTIAGLTVFYK